MSEELWALVAYYVFIITLLVTAVSTLAKSRNPTKPRPRIRVCGGCGSVKNWRGRSICCEGIVYKDLEDWL